jgi:hypothetical protein
MDGPLANIGTMLATMGGTDPIQRIGGVAGSRRLESRALRNPAGAARAHQAMQCRFRCSTPTRGLGVGSYLVDLGVLLASIANADVADNR